MAEIFQNETYWRIKEKQKQKNYKFKEKNVKIQVSFLCF